MKIAKKPIVWMALCALWMSCAEFTWSPGARGNCDPSQSPLGSQKLWSDTMEARGFLRACLRVSWSGSAGQKQALAVLIEVHKGGELRPYQADTQSFPARPIRLLLPTNASTPQFQIMAFGSAFQTTTTEQQLQLCQQNMAREGYRCLEASESECWFQWDANPRLNGSSQGVCKLQLRPQEPASTEGREPERSTEAGFEPAADSREPGPEPPTRDVTDAGEPVAEPEPLDAQEPSLDAHGPEPPPDLPATGQARVQTLAGPEPAFIHLDLRGMTVRDSTGQVFLADARGHQILEFLPTTNRLRVFAGRTGMGGLINGDKALALFNQPVDVYAVGDKLYVLESFSGSIRIIDLTQGQVTTLLRDTELQAGHSLAVLPRTGEILVSLTARNQLLYFDKQLIKVKVGTGSKGSIDGGHAAASFRSPQGLVAQADGTFLIADTNNHRIRQFDPVSSKVTTVAGSTQGYVDDTGTKAKFLTPTDLAVSSTSKSKSSIFVVDRGNHAIRSIDHKGNVKTLAGDSCSQNQGCTPTEKNTGLRLPSHLAYAPNQQLVYLRGYRWIRSFPIPTSPALATISSRYPWVLKADVSGVAHLARFHQPGAIASRLLSSRQGVQLAVADQLNHKIRVVGVPLPTFLPVVVGLLVGSGSRGRKDGLLNAAQLDTPSGVLFNAKLGTLYFSEAGNHTVRAIEPGKSTRDLAGSGAPGHLLGNPSMLNQPHGLATLVEGKELVVADRDNHCLIWISVTNTATLPLSGKCQSLGYLNSSLFQSQFNSPKGVAVDTQARVVYVADTGNHAIRKVDLKADKVSLLAGRCTGGGCQSGYRDGVGPLAAFRSPSALALDGMGHLYVADTRNHAIRKVHIATGLVTTVAGLCSSGGCRPGYINGLGLAAAFHSPQGIAFHKPHYLFISDTENHVIRWITLP